MKIDGSDENQIRFARVACIFAFALAEHLAAYGKRLRTCRPVEDDAEPVAKRCRVVPPQESRKPAPEPVVVKRSRSPQVCYTAIHTVVHRSSLHSLNT